MTTPSLIRLSCQAMGCLCEIYLGGESQTELEAVAADALALLKQWEQRFSHYLPQSEICQLNANAYRQPVSVSPYLFSLLLRLKTQG